MLVTAGEGIRSDGRSTYWFFSFDFKNSQAQGYFEVKAADGFDPDDSPYMLAQEIWSFPRPGTTMAQMLEEGKVSAGVVREEWLNELERHPRLPIPFRDSPEAMLSLSELSGGGVNDTSHPGLDTTFLPSGEAAWRFRADDATYHTPFAVLD